MEALTIEQMRDFYKRVYENTLNNINMLQDQMEKLINLWIVYSAHDQGMPQEINEVILEWLLMYKKGIQYLKRLTNNHISTDSREAGS